MSGTTRLQEYSMLLPTNSTPEQCTSVQIKTHFHLRMKLNESKHNLTKIYGKGHAWHNSVLSHCKTFGTRDGGTRGALATSVAPYITRNAHVSTHKPHLHHGSRIIQATAAAASLCTPRQSCWALGSCETTFQKAKSRLESGVTGSCGPFPYLQLAYQTYDPLNSLTYIVIAIQRIQKSIT